MDSDSAPRTLLAELKRRHVFRVAAVYAAVAWGVLEGAGTLVQLLDLPAWTGKLVVALVLLGFPIALVLSWAYDLTPRGVERTPADAGARRSAASDERGPADEPVRQAAAAHAPQPAHDRARTGPRHPLRWMMAGALVLVLGLGAAILLRYRSVQASPTVVAVLPFSARGTAAYLGDGMVDLLSRNLDGVEHLRAVDPGTIVTLSKHRGQGDAIDVEKGRELASRAGAGLFVLGNVNEAAGVLRISAALYDLEQADAQPQVQASVQGDSARLFQLVDRLTVQLLAGRKHGAASARLVRTAAATTASLPALKAYLDGERHLRAAEYDSAMAAFRNAVDIDSSFALASYRLGVAANQRGQHEVADAALEQALRFASRLPGRDRRLLEAYSAYQRGEADRAEALYGAIRRDDPDDLEATFELAELLFTFNPARGRPIVEAKPLYEQVLRSDPQFLCPI